MSFASSTTSQQRLRRSPWVLLTLLVISVCINYIDRGNLSVAAATGAFRHELNVNDSDLGILFAAFYCTYSVFQIFSGWLIDRYNVYLAYTAGFVLWSAATIVTGLAGSFSVLLALRLLLGLGEAVAYPAYSRIIYDLFREDQRGFSNALIDAGSRTGPAIGVLAGGLIVAHHGWRMLFISVGLVGSLWLIPWCWYTLRHPASVTTQVGDKAGPGFSEILGQRQAWGTFIGLFCLNYTWYFILNWLPTYLTQERHFSTRMMAWYGSLPFWGVAFTTVTFGWISDRAIRRGASPSKIRIGFVAGGMLLSTLMLPAYLIEDQTISMALLVFACLALGLTSSNFWAITQTLAGREACGRWTGIQNGTGNLAGIIGPYFTGVLVTRTGSFFAAFVAAAVMAALGALSYWLVVRHVSPIEWQIAKNDRKSYRDTIANQ